VVQAAWTLVQAKTQGKPSDAAESLLVFREQQGDGAWKHDYLLSNVVMRDPLPEFARVFQAQHRVEKAQADSPSRRRWVGTRWIGYHRREGVARAGRVVPATPGRLHRRSRMPDPTRRPAPPRA